MAKNYKLTKLLIPSSGLMVLLALGSISEPWAASFSDPTRPPDIWLEAHGIKLQAGSRGEAPSGVQLIMIGPTRKFALVDGKIVKPGKLYKGSKVLDIKSDGIVTRDSSKSLKLIPTVKKTVAANDQPKKSRRKSNKRNSSQSGNGGKQ